VRLETARCSTRCFAGCGSFPLSQDLTPSAPSNPIIIQLQPAEISGIRNSRFLIMPLGALRSHREILNALKCLPGPCASTGAPKPIHKKTKTGQNQSTKNKPAKTNPHKTKHATKTQKRNKKHKHATKKHNHHHHTGYGDSSPVAPYRAYPVAPGYCDSFGSCSAG